MQGPTAEFVSTSCLLGNMVTIGSATCTLSYVAPATPLTPTINKITGTVSCDEAGSSGEPLPGLPGDPVLPGEGISEYHGNNVVETCAM